MDKIDYSKLPVWTKRPRPFNSLDKILENPKESDSTTNITEEALINTVNEKPSLLKLPMAVQKVSENIGQIGNLMRQEHRIINENLSILLSEIRSTTGYRAKITELEQKNSELEELSSNKDELINDLKTEVALRNETMLKVSDALTAFSVEAAYLDLIRTMRDGVQVDINSKKKVLEGALSEVTLLLKQSL